MKLYFKQRLLSWFDSYDIYNQYDEVAFTVKGQLSWGHLFKIYDARGVEVGTVKEKLLHFLPTFELYSGGRLIGTVKREFTFFKPKYNIDFNGWQVNGNWLEWDYSITDQNQNTVATLTKQVFHWTDQYDIYIENPNDSLAVVMFIVAMDAEKCSRNS